MIKLCFNFEEKEIGAELREDLMTLPPAEVLEAMDSAYLLVRNHAAHEIGSDKLILPVGSRMGA